MKLNEKLVTSPWAAFFGGNQLWSKTMASKPHISMSEELINALYIKPYTGMIPYLSPSSALMVSDFENCPLARDHWLDLPLEDSHHNGRKSGIQIVFLRHLTSSLTMKQTRFERKC